MYRRLGERGDGRLGVIVWLALIGAGIFAAARIVPMKIAVMSLHDYVDQQVQAAGAANSVDESKVLDSITAKAKELNLPLDRKRMKLEVGERDIRLRLQHEVEVDLAVYQWTWDYDQTFQHMRF